MRLIWLLIVLIQLKGFEQHPSSYQADYEQRQDDSIEPHKVHHSRQHQDDSMEPHQMRHSRQSHQGSYPGEGSQSSPFLDYENPRNNYQPSPSAAPMFGDGAPQQAFPRPNVMYLPPSQPNGPYRAQIKLPENIGGYQLVHSGEPTSSDLDYNQIVKEQLSRQQVPQNNQGKLQTFQITVPPHQNDYQMPRNYHQPIPQNHGQYVPQGVPQYFPEQVQQYAPHDSTYQSMNNNRDGAYQQFNTNPQYQIPQQFPSYVPQYNIPQDRQFPQHNPFAQQNQFIPKNQFAQQNNFPQYNNFPQAHQDLQPSQSVTYPQSHQNTGPHFYQDGYQVVNEYPENQRSPYNPTQSQQQGGQFDEEGFQIINEGPVNHYVSVGMPSTEIIVPKHTSSSETHANSRSESSNNINYENDQSENKELNSRPIIQTQQENSDMMENEQSQVSQKSTHVPQLQESDIQQSLSDADIIVKEDISQDKCNDTKSER